MSDLVEATQDMKGAELEALEHRLGQTGAPSLVSMRKKQIRRVYRILDRGNIQNDDEWRILNALLSDVADRTLNDSAREIAGRLLADYALKKR